MKKTEQIIIKQPWLLICVFINKKKRLLDVINVLDKANKYAGLVFKLFIFNQLKVAELGELYWEDLSKLKKLKGEVIKCAYDMYPDLAFMKSQPFKKRFDPDY